MHPHEWIDVEVGAMQALIETHPAMEAVDDRPIHIFPSVSGKAMLL